MGVVHSGSDNEIRRTQGTVMFGFIYDGDDLGITGDHRQLRMLKAIGKGLVG